MPFYLIWSIHLHGHPRSSTWWQLQFKCQILLLSRSQLSCQLLNYLFPHPYTSNQQLSCQLLLCDCSPLVEERLLVHHIAVATVDLCMSQSGLTHCQRSFNTLVIDCPWPRIGLQPVGLTHNKTVNNIAWDECRWNQTRWTRSCGDFDCSCQSDWRTWMFLRWVVWHETLSSEVSWPGRILVTIGNRFASIELLSLI